MKVRLKSFLFLNMWCMHNEFISWMWIFFQKFYFLFFILCTTTDLFFFLINQKSFFIFYFYLFFTLHKNRSDFFLIKSFIFFLLWKQIWFFFYKPSLILFTLKTDLVILLKRRHIHEVNLFSLILAKCLSYEFNISFNIMQRGYIGHWSLGDQILSG